MFYDKNYNVIFSKLLRRKMEPTLEEYYKATKHELYKNGIKLNKIEDDQLIGRLNNFINRRFISNVKFLYEKNNSAKKREIQWFVNEYTETNDNYIVNMDSKVYSKYAYVIITPSHLIRNYRINSILDNIK
jgi:hypothetical protein